MQKNPVQEKKNAKPGMRVVTESVPELKKEDYEKARKEIESNLFSVFRKYIP